MSYVRRQRTGSMEYGDKKLRDDSTGYEVDLSDVDEGEQG